MKRQRFISAVLVFLLTAVLGIPQVVKGEEGISDIFCGYKLQPG